MKSNTAIGQGILNGYWWILSVFWATDKYKPRIQLEWIKERCTMRLENYLEQVKRRIWSLKSCFVCSNVALKMASRPLELLTVADFLLVFAKLSKAISKSFAKPCVPVKPMVTWLTFSESNVINENWSSGFSPEWEHL